MCGRYLPVEDNDDAERIEPGREFPAPRQVWCDSISNPERSRTVHYALEFTFSRLIYPGRCRSLNAAALFASAIRYVMTVGAAPGYVVAPALSHGCIASRFLQRGDRAHEGQPVSQR